VEQAGQGRKMSEGWKKSGGMVERPDTPIRSLFFFEDSPALYHPFIFQTIMNVEEVGM
jgi:hypothetical protein